MHTNDIAEIRIVRNQIVNEEVQPADGFHVVIINDYGGREIHEYDYSWGELAAIMDAMGDRFIPEDHDHYAPVTLSAHDYALGTGLALAVLAIVVAVEYDAVSVIFNWFN